MATRFIFRAFSNPSIKCRPANIGPRGSILRTNRKAARWPAGCQAEFKSGNSRCFQAISFMAGEPAGFVLYIRKLMKKNLIFEAILSCFFAGFAEAQQTVYLVDGFDPGGVGGNIYSNGQIGNVWANW